MGRKASQTSAADTPEAATLLSSHVSFFNHPPIANIQLPDEAGGTPTIKQLNSNLKQNLQQVLLQNDSPSFLWEEESSLTRA